MKHLKIPLRDFQTSGVEYALSHFYTMIADEMRLGKSPQAIATYLNSDAKKWLIICPSYLKVNWKLEIKKFSEKQLDIQILNTGKDFTKIDYLSDVYIISYSMVEKAEELFRICDMVAIDEAHYLKNPEAKRTEAVHKAIWEYNPKRLLLLTGTPFKNRIPELYSLLALLSYDRSGTNGIDILKHFPKHKDFCDFFCFKELKSVPTPYGRKTIPKYFGLRNKDKLMKLLGNKFIRRKYNEVFKDEEPVVNDIVMSEKSVKDLQLLLDAVKGNRGNDPAFATIKARNALHKSKFTAEHALNIFDSIEGPIIIFSDHIDSTYEIAKHLSSHRVERVDGQVSTAKRAKIVEDFKAGNVDFLVCTIGSMSTGNDFSRSNYMVINDLPHVKGDLDQALKRIQGINQKRRCYYDFISGSPIDLQITMNLRSKERDLKQI